MMNTETVAPELSFDQYLLNASTQQEVVELRQDADLLLTQPAETFCRMIVLFGKLPIDAYEIAYATEETYFDEALGMEMKRWIKPQHPAYLASELVKKRDVIDYIKMLRAQVIEYGKIERAEVIQSLKAITLDPGAKNTDKIAAANSLSKLEGFNKEQDTGQGGSLTIVMPWVPQQLTSAPPMKEVGGEVLDN